jgi:hypothetical protein
MAALKVIFWLTAIAVAVLRPNLANPAWRQLEHAAARVARHPVACWMGPGLIVLLVRAALLPLWPAPQPVIYDEFGYLLQADTFAAGRLTNPPHPLWPFFESVYILHQPTYNAKYPPGQGLALALGQRIFGDPWFGVWLSCGAMMAALCWALQGWLPASWALLGGLLALPLCLFSYWMDSYWGGAVAAAGGALVLGSYARMVRRRRFAFAWLMGIGLVILALTRMYEGLLFAAPFVVALLVRRRSFRVWAPIALVLAAGAAFTLEYNARVTGHATRFPYTEYQRQYGYVPSFNIQPLNAAITYRNLSVANVFFKWEYDRWKRSRSWGLVVDRFREWGAVVTLVAGGAPLMLVFLGFLWTTAQDRRMFLPLAGLGAVFLGSFLQIVYNAHYAAPATAAVLLLLVQSFRHLRHSRLPTAIGGRALGRVIPAAMLIALFAAQGTRLYRQETIEQTKPVNARRGKIECRLLDQNGGRHLIVVRYTGTQNPHEEWVYNRADIDASDVVWAHDMGAEENRNLIGYFKDRTAWLFQPDVEPESLAPY